MSRRELVRISLGEAAVLAGDGGSVSCTVVEVSAGGALLTLAGRLPSRPLTLRFALAGERLVLPVEVNRVPQGGGRVAVGFERAAHPTLHRLIAAEQRQAGAQGRLVVVERRMPVRAARGEVL
jgi:hypothetical protein